MPRSLALLLLIPAVAAAQDEEPASSATKGKDEVVREVNRGLYLKANVGSTSWLNTHGYTRNGGASPLLAGVISTALGVGGEFIDRERFTAAWEVDVYQGLFNGPRTDELGTIPSFIQGDVHMVGGLASLEFSGYPTRRLGLGAAVGGGVIVMPLLMEPTAYNDTIVAALWGGQPASLNEGPLPTVALTPTIEYYTKLSHFSLGADVAVMYVIGFDLGVAPSGYFKYTF